VGIFEEAEGEFYAEDAAHGLVDCGHGDASGFDECRELGVVEVGHHVDVNAGIENSFCGGGGVERDAVVEEFHDSGVVADDESVEAHSLRRTVLRRYALVVPETPLNALKEIMTVVAPASTAELYGGR
jgi:hypothetical protein